MDRSFLMNVGNHLKQPLDQELTKIEALRAKALNSKATLSDHTDYNIAFEHARKNYEVEVRKVLPVVEANIAAAESVIRTKTELAQSDENGLEVIAKERAALEAELRTIQAEIDRMDGHTGTTSGGVQDILKKMEASDASPTLEEVDAHLEYTNEYEEACMNVRTCSFRLKNKLSPPTEEELKELRRQAKNVQQMKPARGEAYDASLTELNRLVEDVSLQASLAQSSGGAAPMDLGEPVVSAETEALLLKRKQQEEDFMKESAKLLHWCRQQKTDLEALTEPDHIQKFCSALEVNYKTMYDNFEMLSAMGQELMGKQVAPAPSNYRVESTLMECNEVWLNLLVYAHEILQHTMLEIHARSKLEDEVRAFSSYSTRFRETLSSLREMFSLPMDEESKEVVAGVLEQTEALEKNYEPFRDLGDNLKDFSLRMECIRDNYQNLRRTVLSRLTFLTAQSQSQQLATSAIPGATVRSRRMEEYAAKTKDLSEWVTRKDAGESCSEIHARIESIKALIDREYENVQRDMKQLAALTA